MKFIPWKAKPWKIGGAIVIGEGEKELERIPAEAGMYAFRKLVDGNVESAGHLFANGRKIADLQIVTPDYWAPKKRGPKPAPSSRWKAIKYRLAHYLAMQECNGKKLLADDLAGEWCGADPREIRRARNGSDPCPWAKGILVFVPHDKREPPIAAYLAETLPTADFVLPHTYAGMLAYWHRGMKSPYIGQGTLTLG